MMTMDTAVQCACVHTSAERAKGARVPARTRKRQNWTTGPVEQGKIPTIARTTDRLVFWGIGVGRRSPTRLAPKINYIRLLPAVGRLLRLGLRATIALVALPYKQFIQIRGRDGETKRRKARQGGGKGERKEEGRGGGFARSNVNLSPTASRIQIQEERKG